MSRTHSMPGLTPWQVWRPRRGRPGPAIEIANIHRADRLIEAIDADATDRITAKRTMIRFCDLQAGYTLDTGQAAR